MAQITTTVITNAIQTYFDRNLMKVFIKTLKAGDFAQQRKITNGNTVRFLRMEKMTRPAVMSEGGLPTPQALSINYLECTLAEYALAAQPTDWAMHDILMGELVKNISDRMGYAMAEGADYQTMKKLCTHGYRVPSGLDLSRRAKGTATSGSTSTLVCSTLAGAFADDDFNGATLMVYEGTNKGLAREVYDFTASTCTFAFTGDLFPQANDSTSKFICWKRNGTLVAPDTNSFLILAAMAKNHGAKKPAGQAGMPMLVPPSFMPEFFKDTIFQTQQLNIPNNHYQDAEVKKWGSLLFLEHDQPYVEDTAGAEAETTGSRLLCPIIGQDSYSIGRQSKGSGKYGIENFIVDKPDHTNITMAYTSMGSKHRFVAEVTNAENLTVLEVPYVNYV
jgi:hypothetical protein